MNAYCKKIGAELDSVRFLFDGNRLRPDQTPADLDMEDEGTIRFTIVYTHQEIDFFLCVEVN
jgi:hypothetical protein